MGGLAALEIRQLETFFWIATLGGFNAAARQLNTTQPAISARIQGLENELGGPLFERSTNPVQLTPKGLALLPGVRAALEALDALRDTASGRHGLAGAVRLGVASVVAHAWLPGALRRLHELHPALEVEVKLGNAPTLRQGLNARELDLVVTIQPFPQADTIARPLGAHPIEWMCSPDLDLPSGTLAPADLAAHRILALSSSTDTHQSVIRLFRAGGIQGLRLTRCNATAVLLELAEQGLGLCALPPVLAARALQQGRLRVLDVRPRLPALEFFVTHRTGPMQQRAAILAELLLEAAGSEVSP